MSTKEFSRAEQCLIIENQKTLLQDNSFENLSRQSNVQPKQDKKGINRCHWRLQNDPLQFEQKNPILRNGNHKFNELISD